MHSYTELSPSGKGIHILFRAPHFDYDKSKYYINNQSEGIEAYIAGATNKFVTITGKRLVGSPHDLQERSSQLSEVLETYMRRREWDRAERQEGEFTDLHLTDDDILRLVVEHSPRFGALLDGDISDYDNDQSRADKRNAGEQRHAGNTVQTLAHTRGIALVIGNTARNQHNK